MDKNTSHLAGEFLVAGELARRGLSVAITFGNAKSVDIFAESQNHKYCVDAKAIRAKTNWPISRAQIRRDVIYVFACLGSDHAISKNEPPEFFVIAGDDILAKNLILSWQGNRTGVTYQALSAGKYRNAWGTFK